MKKIIMKFAIAMVVALTMLAAFSSNLFAGTGEAAIAPLSYNAEVQQVEVNTLRWRQMYRRCRHHDDMDDYEACIDAL